MNGTLAEESSSLLVELHDALSELDRRARRRNLGELGPRIDAVRTQLDALTDEPRTPLATRIATLAQELSDAPDADRRGPWLQFRARVQPAYEAVVHDLRRESVDVPSLRPTNYWRNALHVTSSVSGLAAIELSPSPLVPIAIAAAFTVVGWSMEIGRRRSERINAFCLRLFGKTAHPHEAHRINSATWYATALLVIALVQSTAAAAVGLIVLGLGDPAAAIIGKRFGRHKLLYGRTLEGTLSFMLVGALASFTFLRVAHPSLAVGVAALAAVAGGFAGAIAELVSRRLDDNLTIPLAAFAAAWLVTG
jgi:dolichol kinase